MQWDRITKAPIPGLNRPAGLPQTHRKISKPEAERRLKPVVGLLASGQAPLDEHSAQALKYVLDRQRARLRKAGV